MAALPLMFGGPVLAGRIATAGQGIQARARSLTGCRSVVLTDVTR
jgi:hypothetical protein